MQPTLAFAWPGCELTAVSQSDPVLTLTAHPTAPTARGPRGGMSASRLHRDDTRRPRDLPLGACAVRVVVHVRRFRCLNASGTAHPCAERWPQVVRPAAHRTMRLTTALQPWGRALGGEAGARLGATLAMPASPETLLRLSRQLPEPITSTPAVLGGDDGAMRRGHPDGPLVGALARHRPIDLVPDRTAETLAPWLLAPPGVSIRSRDRSTESARGATLGAPEAQHVLARWHRVRHRREALERLLDRLHRRLAARSPARQVATASELSIDLGSLRRSTPEQMARQERRARRVARDQEVRALHAQGLSTRHRATPLQRRRTTVIRYLRTDAFPERAQPRRVRVLAPYGPDRQKRWDAGCHPGLERWRAMQALGFSGPRRLVSKWVVLRRALQLGRPSAGGRRPALPKEPAVRLLPVAAAGAGDRLPAPRPLVWFL